MVGMSFLLSNEQLIKLASLGEPTFTDASFAWVFWETKTDIVKEFLPPGLSIVDPYAIAYVANFPKTNFSPPYKESALFLAVQSETGKKGIYCLAMPVTNEIALFAGRDAGYPKKIASINYDENKGIITGSAERYGQKFVEIILNTNKKLNLPSNSNMLEYISSRGAFVFNIMNNHTDSFESSEAKSFVVRQRIKIKADRMEFCEAKINLNPSKFDPWSTIPIKNIICGMVSQGQTKMMELNMDHPIPLLSSMTLNLPRMSDIHHFIS
jgi:acetoacetate decarboxylase